MRFSFIGTFHLDLSSDKDIRKGVTKNGDEYISINPSIISDKNNRIKCELFGMKTSVIKTKDTDNNNVDIDWGDRNNPEVINSVAGYRQNVIVIDGNRYVTITSYDAIKHILENMTNINDKRVVVTGQSQKDFYNGKSRDRFIINNIYTIPEDDERKNGLSATAIVFWDKSGIDISEFEKEKLIYINGYTSEYINEEKATRYVAQQFVINCTKIDFEKEKHLLQARAKLREMGMDYKDGKLAITMKAKGYAVNEFDVKIKNGAKEVEFSLEDCTEKQREYIELGIKTLDDFRPRGGLYGNWITEYLILTPTLRGNYIDGMSYLDEKPAEFEEKIYTPVKDENIDDVLPFEEVMPKPVTDDDDGIDNLFDV